MNTQKIDTWTSRLLTALAFAAFVLSYAGMWSIATDAGYHPFLAFVWPAATEAAVVIFSLVYLASKLHGYRSYWIMPLIIGCTILSASFNVYHASQPDWFLRLVWALPPLLLFAAFKTWIWKVELDTRRLTTVTALADLRAETERARAEAAGLRADIEALTAKRDVIKSELDQLRKEKKQSSYTGIGDETRARAYAILAERSGISGAELGRLLGKSDSTGRKLKKQLLPVVNENGNKELRIDRLVDALPMDEAGKGAIKRSVANGREQ